ncbi:hypothetical protein HPP92_000424 [Vanilla planifolia]|uniref:BHLH domain-containing protein n=1 Tax=Vanilla planifolia TaxID=51239 RepID=A0A835RS32_VANPL|nr:hypothetical protein HPP92_000424 [Vanilla planifolia]
MNCGAPPTDQLLPPCLNLNWDQSVDPLSSIIPSQLQAEITGEFSSLMRNPLNSMHANRLMPLPSDPSFAERAARYSSFSSGNYEAFPCQFAMLEAGKLSRASSSQCLKAKEIQSRSRTESEMVEGEIGSGQEDSSVTGPASAPGESSTKKRKAVTKNRGKVTEQHNQFAKKMRSDETKGNEKDFAKPKGDEDDAKEVGKEISFEAPEAPKDYIHVRARRGQATDSHSLAERVRREKISQRMKLLQDLVPGCNRITGKALMLDEIINYVQSLQRQVEFLSMKLATLNPRLEFNLESLFPKDSVLNQANLSMPNSFYPLDNLAAAFPFGHQSKEGNPLPFTVSNGMGMQCSMSQMPSTIHHPASIQSSFDMFGGAASQVGNVWDDELHSVLQTDFGKNQEIGATSQTFNGVIANSSR